MIYDTCPACSHPESTPHASLANVQTCNACGGIFGTLHVFETREVVDINAPMLANAEPEDMQYFDLMQIGSSTEDRRIHGWMQKSTHAVVQWG